MTRVEPARTLASRARDAHSVPASVSEITTMRWPLLLLCGLAAPAAAQQTLAGALAEPPGVVALSRPAAVAYALAPEPTEAAEQIAYELFFLQGLPTLDAVDIETIDIIVDAALELGAARVTVVPDAAPWEAAAARRLRASLVRENLLAHGLAPEIVRLAPGIVRSAPEAARLASKSGRPPPEAVRSAPAGAERAPRVVVPLDRLGALAPLALDRPAAFELPPRLTP